LNTSASLENAAIAKPIPAAFRALPIPFTPLATPPVVSLTSSRLSSIRCTLFATPSKSF